MSSPLQTYLVRAIELAREAGELQRAKLWQPIRIEHKGAIDLVTEVDKASEALLVSGLQQSFPEHDFLAEENDYGNRGASHKWIIDPLDGTTNFAHGFPWFAVSMALEIDGEVRLGVVFHPMMNELFCAIKGAGATLNGTRLQVSARAPLGSALLATGFPYDSATDRDNNFAHFIKFQMACRGIRRAGAAALDLAYVAAGRIDGFWEGKLKPWDVAAGQLLVQEAGGRVTGYDGADYSVYNNRIVASNGLLHDEMVAMLGRAAPVGALSETV